MLRFGRPARLVRFRSAWLFMTGAGLSAMVFGVLFGEFFWPHRRSPCAVGRALEQPVLLLEVAIGIGAVPLSGAYAIGTINRWREGGWRLAVVSPTAFLRAAVPGLGLLPFGAHTGISWLVATGVVVIVGVGADLRRAADRCGRRRGRSGTSRVELFDGCCGWAPAWSPRQARRLRIAHAALGAIVGCCRGCGPPVDWRCWPPPWYSSSATR